LISKQPYADTPFTKGSLGKSASLRVISVNHQFQFTGGKTTILNRQRYGFLHRRRPREYNTGELFGCQRIRDTTFPRLPLPHCVLLASPLPAILSPANHSAAMLRETELQKASWFTKGSSTD